MNAVETTSPAGLSWSQTSDVHWYLMRNGKTVGSVYWNSTGYRILMYYIQTDNILCDTLAEAQAVAIALIAMRDKK